MFCFLCDNLSPLYVFSLSEVVVELSVVVFPGEFSVFGSCDFSGYGDMVGFVNFPCLNLENYFYFYALEMFCIRCAFFFARAKVVTEI